MAHRFEIRKDLEVVAIQAAASLPSPVQRSARLEAAALHEPDIKIPIVVVVEQRGAGPADFGLIEPAVHAVHVHEVETGLTAVIRKPFDFAGGWMPRRRSAPAMFIT